MLKNHPPMPTFAVVGECMLEFYQEKNDLFHLGFAGDTYNVAVYFSRATQDQSATTAMITAVGEDVHSKRMLVCWERHQVSARHVRRIAGRMPGLYLIETSETGERDFYYYRSESAARYMFDGPEGDRLLQSLLDCAYVYFSGITLAILKEESLNKFIEFLPQLKANGSVLCYDLNYRPRLWASREQALFYHNLVLPFVDIALPSLSDSQLLCEDTDFEHCADRYLQQGAQRVVVKEGQQGYFIATPYLKKRVAVMPVVPVDTTGAGDSFNGTYLAHIMQGDSDELACQKAAALSRQVVLCRGAII